MSHPVYGNAEDPTALMSMLWRNDKGKVTLTAALTLTGFPHPTSGGENIVVYVDKLVGYKSATPSGPTRVELGATPRMTEDYVARAVMECLKAAAFYEAVKKEA